MNNEWREIEDRRQQMQESSRRLFVLGAAVAITFLAAAHYFGSSKNEVASAPVPEAEAVQLPVVAAPEVERSPTATYRTQSTGAGRQTYVGVYECVVNGQRVVSDQPCGPDAKERTLVVDQPDPAEAARLRREAGVAGQSTAASTRNVADGGKTYCIYVRSRVTGETKAHTCRWFNSFQSCAEAAARIDGRCGLPKQ